MIVQFNDIPSKDKAEFHRIDSKDIVSYEPVPVKDVWNNHDRIATRLFLKDGTSVLLQIWEPRQVKVELAISGWQNGNSPVPKAKPPRRTFCTTTCTTSDFW